MVGRDEDDRPDPDIGLSPTDSLRVGQVDDDYERGRLARRRQRDVNRPTAEAAFRHRAGLIALLSCCTCGYPLVDSTTPTGHPEWCQAHAMTLSEWDRQNRDDREPAPCGDVGRADDGHAWEDRETGPRSFEECCLNCGWSLKEIDAHDREHRLFLAGYGPTPPEDERPPWDR